MKKILTMLLALAMVFTLFACGSKKPAEVPTEAATEATEVPTTAPTEVLDTEETEVTAEATEAPAAESTTKTTKATTAVPTTKATKAATVAPTTKATKAATVAPTTKATAESTTKAAAAPTTAPTKSAACNHSYKDATCTEPKTCSNCGATTGDAAGHNWTAATDTKPETCKNCGETKELPKQWTFTDGGDCIIASDGINTTRVAIDTSHLPQNYETETQIQTIEVFRGRFRYANGWIVYFESYNGSVQYKDSDNVPGFSDEVGYSIIKMDGTGQKMIFEADAVVGYMDGYLYYQKAEGYSALGETEYHWLCKRSFSEDGTIGEEIVVAELENEWNEYFEDAWFEDGWVFYSYCYDFDVVTRSVYKVLPDGTQCQKVS